MKNNKNDATIASSVASSSSGKKSVGTGFWIGMIVAPWLTPFFTLRDGYSRNIRVVAFAWFGVVIGLGIAFRDNAAPTAGVPAASLAVESSATTHPPALTGYVDLTHKDGDDTRFSYLFLKAMPSALDDRLSESKKLSDALFWFQIETGTEHLYSDKVKSLIKTMQTHKYYVRDLKGGQYSFVEYVENDQPGGCISAKINELEFINYKEFCRVKVPNEYKDAILKIPTEDRKYLKVGVGRVYFEITGTRIEKSGYLYVLSKINSAEYEIVSSKGNGSIIYSRDHKDEVIVPKFRVDF